MAVFLAKSLKYALLLTTLYVDMDTVRRDNSWSVLWGLDTEGRLNLRSLGLLVINTRLLCIVRANGIVVREVEVSGLGNRREDLVRVGSRLNVQSLLRLSIDSSLADDLSSLQSVSKWRNISLREENSTWQ